MSWSSVRPLSQWNGAPRQSGVYALFWEEENCGLLLQYIGSAQSLYQRLCQHARGGGSRLSKVPAMMESKDVMFKYKLTVHGRHLTLEDRLIKRLRPPLNKRGIKLAIPREETTMAALEAIWSRPIERPFATRFLKGVK